MTMLLGVGTVTVLAQDLEPAQMVREPRTIVVARDGSGQYTSIQEAVDDAKSGDTIRIKGGEYQEDVTIHSKDGLRLIGDGVDKVTVLGRERVGVFHIGKWPYGATQIEISGMTIREHGGHAMGIFNGKSIVLHDVRINGMLFGQQVQDVRIERCSIGGSETTGVQFADSQAALVGNLIHDNDHGVTVAGKSDVRLERNVITRNLFEGVIVTDNAKAVLISNTITKNGGGVAFLNASKGEASGNVVGLNQVGFLIAPSSHPTLSYNAVHNTDHNYIKSGDAPTPAPELKPETDVTADPQFVDSGRDDFRPRRDSRLVRVGKFAYLGALPPVD
ncbi:right-handed parallel beta-helix repeat-containing protein [Nitrospira sp. Nam74]